ncbi:uncharacterized protein LOC144632483 [Oculina patagonica]
MAEICNKMMECFTSGYQALTDLEHKEDMSFDAVEADIEEMNEKWTTLETETRSKIKETVEYFSQFRENEPEESEFDSIKERASQLKMEHEKLYTRHTDLVGAVEVDPGIVERQYNYSKKMKEQIVNHATKALIAAILLGMILGGVIAWRTYNAEIIPIVLGVFAGGGSVTIIGGLAYLILISVARRGVKKWEGLRDRVSKLKVLDKLIEKKTEDLYPVPNILLDRILNKHTNVTRGSIALIKQCDKYNETST